MKNVQSSNAVGTYSYKIKVLLKIISHDSHLLISKLLASKKQCCHCNKTFSQQKNLNQHIARIHNAHRYKCNDCDALLSSGFRLKTHLSLVHKKKTKIKFVKSCLVVKTQNGYETSADAKKYYIIREQAERIQQLQISIKRLTTVIERLRKLIAGGGKTKRTKTDS